MLMSLLENLQQTNPLQGKVTGIVVDNKDPEGLKRIKVKVQTIYESQDPANLPWVYPMREAGGGARGDTSGHEIPENNTMVYVEFPTGDIHYGVYSGIPTTPQSAQGIFNSNPVPQAPDSELHIQNGSDSNEAGDDGYGDGGSDSGVVAGDSATDNMLGKVWTNLTEMGNKALSWIRHDKNQGTSEFFQGSGKGNNGAPGGGFIRMDRSGNAQIHIPGNLDWVVRGNSTMKVMGMLQHSVGGNHYENIGGDHVNRTGGAQTAVVSGDHDMKVGGNSGHSSQGKHGKNAQQIMMNSGYKPGTAENKDSDHSDQLAALQTRNDLIDQKITAMQQQHDAAVTAGNTEDQRLQGLAQGWSGTDIG